MTIRKAFFAAALSATLLQFASVAGAEEIYAPYRECMSRCASDLSVCMDNISTKADDAQSLSEQCTATNATCVQECQFLPIPGEPEQPAPAPQS